MGEQAMRLERAFYVQPTLQVAERLLGMFLVCDRGGVRGAGRIVETEAYLGARDPASHAYGGKRTSRNRAVYMRGGHVYIYLVYGMHWMLNVSTRAEGEPECVLIRALEPHPGEPEISGDPEQRPDGHRVASGPGKLCSWLGLDGSVYGEDLVVSTRLWIESRGKRVPPGAVVRAPRVGIDYAAEPWRSIPWRLYLADSRAVSRK
jgi:DNA-3-methyladenine glycosylase